MATANERSDGKQHDRGKTRVLPFHGGRGRARAATRQGRSGPAERRGNAAVSCMLVCEDEERAAQVAASIVCAGIEFRATTTLTTEHAAHILRSRAVVVLVPGENTLDSIGRLAELGIEAPVLVLEEDVDEVRRSALLAYGATECHPLPISSRSLSRVLSRLALQTGRRITTSLWFDETTHQVGRGDASVRLSPHEFAMLRCLADRNGEPVPVSRLQLFTWGAMVPQRSERQIVTVLVCRLRKKLALIGLQNAIVVVRRIGYAFRPELPGM